MEQDPSQRINENNPLESQEVRSNEPDSRTSVSIPTSPSSLSSNLKASEFEPTSATPSSFSPSQTRFPHSVPQSTPAFMFNSHIGAQVSISDPSLLNPPDNRLKTKSSNLSQSSSSDLFESFSNEWSQSFSNDDPVSEELKSGSAGSLERSGNIARRAISRLRPSELSVEGPEAEHGPENNWLDFSPKRKDQAAFKVGDQLPTVPPESTNSNLLVPASSAGSTLELFNLASSQDVTSLELGPNALAPKIVVRTRTSSLRDDTNLKKELSRDKSSASNHSSPSLLHTPIPSPSDIKDASLTSSPSSETLDSNHALKAITYENAAGDQNVNKSNFLEPVQQNRTGLERRMTSSNASIKKIEDQDLKLMSDYQKMEGNSSSPFTNLRNSSGPFFLSENEHGSQSPPPQAAAHSRSSRLSNPLVDFKRFKLASRGRKNKGGKWKSPKDDSEIKRPEEKVKREDENLARKLVGDENLRVDEKYGGVEGNGSTYLEEARRKTDPALDPSGFNSPVDSYFPPFDDYSSKTGSAPSEFSSLDKYTASTSIPISTSDFLQRPPTVTSRFSRLETLQELEEKAWREASYEREEREILLGQGQVEDEKKSLLRQQDEGAGVKKSQMNSRRIKKGEEGGKEDENNEEKEARRKKLKRKETEQVLSGDFHSRKRRSLENWAKEEVEGEGKDSVCEMRNSNATSYATRMNQPQVATPVSLMADDSPSYISARSANSLISESRPTRIQVDTLFILNRLLDELLLLILSSAKSLSTERIKTHGVLKVLNNSALARNSVLEAELELRSYLDGKRAEGGKVPLGLMATSRWDGTENWPVASAYGMLRTRCQYYSTLGDLEDESSSSLGDQHIMSTDGRPIATITPGVAIYVTALLEFVGEYILQKVGSVIERDNSDEASLSDLVSALTEDESLASLYNRMEIKNYVSSRMKASHLGSKKKASGSVKPWQVPDDDDYDEAAGTGGKFNSKRSSIIAGSRRSNINATPISTSTSGSSHERGASIGTHSSHVTDSNDHPSGLNSSSSATGFSSNHTNLSSFNSSDSNHHDSSIATNNTSPTAASSGSHLTRRASTDRWGGQIFGGKRRGSLRMSQDGGSSGGKLLQGGNQAPPAVSLEDEDPEDDFEAALNNPGTMKVSLTPNRLRTIEVTEKEAQAKRSSRRRPGTLSPLEVRAAEVNGNSPRATPVPSPVPTVKSRSSHRDGDSLPPTPGSARDRNGSAGRGKVPPPSSYRSPSPIVTNQPTFSPTNAQDQDLVNEDDLDDEDRELLGLPTKGKGGRRKNLSASGMSPATSARLQPREGRSSASGATKEMLELFSSTPPGTPQVVQGARDTSRTPSIHSNEGTTSVANKRASGVGGRMRNLFGRKGSASVSGKEAFLPSSNRGSSSSIALGKDSRPSEGSGSGSVRDNLSNNGHAHVSEDNLSSFADSSSTASHSTRPSQQRQVGGSLGRKFSPVSPPLTAMRRTSQSSQAASSSSHRPTPLNLVQSATQENDLAREKSQSDLVSDDPQARGISAEHQIAPASITGAPERVVGLYEEPISTALTDPQNQRPTSPPSPPPQSKEPPPSRKIPWSYSRQSSTGRPGSRAGATTPTSEPRFSAGYGSSAGDHETGYPTRSPGAERDESGISGSRAAPSAWNSVARGDFRDNQRESSDAARLAEAGEGGKTPTPAQVLGFQGPRPRTASTSLATGAYGSRDTVKALTELERRMRTANSVEECRAMVAKALNGALESAGAFATGNGNGGAFPPDSVEIQDIPDEESDANHSRRGGFYGHGGRASTDRKRSDPPSSGATLASLQSRARKPSNNINMTTLPTLPISKAKRPILAMADNSDEELMNLDSHGLVAAWLLDGEDPQPSHQPLEQEKPNPLSISDGEPLNSDSGDATLIAHQGQAPRKHFSASADDTSMNNSLENDNDQDAAFASADEGEKDTANGLLQPKHGHGLVSAPASTNNTISPQRLSSSSLKKSPSIDTRRGGRSSAVSSFYSAHEE